MSDFVLPLFPFDSSALNVTTTVWIGVMVCAFFNLRFGWTLSGLVVPGYLVPLLMTRPVSVAVILVESILVYWIALAISEWPRGLRYWSSFFGRDRFFLILLVSVRVRAALDGFLLPWAGESVVTRYGLDFDYQNNLHSFGLIIVALIANYFWKPGVLRGLPPLSLCVAVTYGLVVWVVAPYTNFSVGNLYLLYEDITSSLLASPKAYILVITTAYLASWVNLRYAWDFNGILIPALLGLLWYEPTKILVSGVECVIVLLVGQAILATPPMQKMTIEGARKLAFFFSVCFLYRLVLCHTFQYALPDLQMTDAFGYGYLLTTLMAVKIHDKKRPIAMLIGTAHVSMAGAIAGSLIGFALLLSPRAAVEATNDVRSVTIAHRAHTLQVIDKELIEQVRLDRVLLYEKQKPESYRVPTEEELHAFESVLTQLADWCEQNSTGANDQAAKQSVVHQLQGFAESFARLNYQMALVDGRFIYLSERTPTRGWGIYAIDLQSSSSLGIQVPAPLEEWATVDAGVRTMQLTGAKSLGIAGAKRKTNLDGSSDVLRVRKTPLMVFQNVFAKHDILQVRGYTESGWREIADSEGIEVDPTGSLQSLESRFYLSRELPADASLSKLRQATNPFAIRWNPSPLINRPRDLSTGNVAEWFLSRQDRRRLIGMAGLGKSGLAADPSSAPWSVRRMSLRTYLSNTTERLLPRDSEQFIPATADQMVFMAMEIVGPLLDAAYVASDNLEEEIRSIDQSARSIGYHVDLLQDPNNDDQWIALSESSSFTSNDLPPKGWGTYVFRVGQWNPLAIEVPRPLLERYSLDFGINLLEEQNGSLLSVSGAHRDANRDQSTDVLLTRNRTSLFNLVRHQVLKQFRDQDCLIVQARAITAPVKADIVVACEDNADSWEALSPLKQSFFAAMHADRSSMSFVSGQAALAGYEMGGMLQSSISQAPVANENTADTGQSKPASKEAISLWLSPSLRRRYSDVSDNTFLEAPFTACGIATIHADIAMQLSDWLLDEGLGVVRKQVAHLAERREPSGAATPEGSRPSANSQIETRLELPQRLVELLSGYTKTNDVLLLADAVKSFPDLKCLRVVDAFSGQAFLCVRTAEGSAGGILNLTGGLSDQVMILEQWDSEQIRDFVRSKSLWLRWHDPLDIQITKEGTQR